MIASLEGGGGMAMLGVVVVVGAVVGLVYLVSGRGRSDGRLDAGGQSPAAGDRSGDANERGSGTSDRSSAA